MFLQLCFIEWGLFTLDAPTILAKPAGYFMIFANSLDTRVGSLDEIHSYTPDPTDGFVYVKAQSKKFDHGFTFNIL